jgi:hypothetical protein
MTPAAAAHRTPRLEPQAGARITPLPLLVELLGPDLGGRPACAGQAPESTYLRRRATTTADLAAMPDEQERHRIAVDRVDGR